MTKIITLWIRFCVMRVHVKYITFNAPVQKLMGGKLAYPAPPLNKKRKV